MWQQVNERTWILGPSTILMDNCPHHGGIHYILYHNGRVDYFSSLMAAQDHVK